MQLIMQPTPLSKLLAVAAVLLLAAVAAPAEPYWITWEGDDYPENQGWQRITYGGGCDRWLAQGTMILDGLASIYIADAYRQSYVPELGPGEIFRAEWRLRVDEVPGKEDPGVFIGAAGFGTLGLIYSENAVFSFHEYQYIAQFTPYEFHEYILTSTDLLTYAFYVDGVHSHDGVFVFPSWQWSDVTWGDCGQGAISRSTWDYFRFGIVPEPGSALLLGLAGAVTVATRAPRTRSQ